MGHECRGRGVMKVIKTRIVGCSGPCVYSYKQEEKLNFVNVLGEIKDCFLDENTNDEFKLTIEDMDEKEFNKLREFDGY
jgi:hypothetical protein